MDLVENCVLHSLFGIEVLHPRRRLVCLHQMGNGLCPPQLLTSFCLVCLFLGRIKHVMSPYVISLTLSFGTMCREIKKNVSVPFVSHPSSFLYEWV